LRTLAPILVTAGEPAGIGPELCLTLAAERDPAGFAVVADPAQLAALAAALSINVTPRIVSDDPADWPEARPGELFVVPLSYPEAIEAGRPDPRNAPAMLEGLAAAIDACRDGRFRALVTAPLQKSTVNDAGIPFSGHTEFLAERTGAAQPVMLLVAGDLRVALATTHLPLRDVPDALNPAALETILRLLDAELTTKFGIEQPRIVVCGLNPHAGEGGHLGTEDDLVIRPVVERLAAEGMNVIGPLPADTAFTPAVGRKDAVLAMYHDQGLPVLKYAGFGHAVNVTLGLPIVRTSVDHGTALDIAGRGQADPGSLLAAFDLADTMTRR
jgi:4-hydroxythreonine-4-phosphate dehydrogenase